MPEASGNGERLDTWKDISAYLGRDVRTVVRWEKERGLPVHRIPGGQRHGVFAYQHELDQWLAGSKSINGGTSIQPSWNDVALEESAIPSTASSLLYANSSRTMFKIYIMAGVIAILLLMAAGYRYMTIVSAPHKPQLIATQQITTNGLEKRGLLTDGKTLYFGQKTDGLYALVAMPVDGGAFRIVWKPAFNAIPADISPDGSKLLALCFQDKEQEHELWVVPLGKGEPRRVGYITAHTVAWAPDSKTLAYAAGNKIFLASEADTKAREIGSFTEFPWSLYWSRNGQQLRFILADASTDKAAKWGEISGDGMKTIIQSPLTHPLIRSSNESICNLGREAYLSQGLSNVPGNTSMVHLQYNDEWWKAPVQITEMKPVTGIADDFACSINSSRIYALNAQQSSTAYMKYDQHRQAFVPILPDISGNYLDYSRDGKWIAYTSSRDASLWVSHADGTDARQITSPQEDVEVPRWSPDGKQLAFMAQHDDGPWRINLLNLENGTRREASESDDRQGAPTWSPDGKSLAYGNVKCEYTDSCAIHIIDLSTGKVRALPGSEGLFTARWSPDGRYIAALNVKGHQLMLFNIKTEKWQKLTDGIIGSDLIWSSDSKYLYVNLPGSGPSIIRISATTGERQTVLDLRSLDALEMTEIDTLPISLAPDDSVILHSRIHAHEIYAYELREQ
jgi:Tol biopolymer transport system component